MDDPPLLRFARPFDWVARIVAIAGLIALIMLVVESTIESGTISYAIIGAIGIGISAFVYKTEVARNHEDKQP
jgi:hypothetical protein